jgi:hypothetical protein
MKKTNTQQKLIPPLKKEIFDAFLKQAIANPKLQTKKKIKKTV